MADPVDLDTQTRETRERLSAARRSDDHAWLPRAACADMDTHLFMQPDRADATRAALTVCAGCEVTEECLDYALRYRVPGVAGGLTEAERENYRRKRRRVRSKRVIDLGGPRTEPQLTGSRHG